MFFYTQLERVGPKHHELILEVFKEKPPLPPFRVGIVVKPGYVGALCSVCHRSAVDRNEKGLRCPKCEAEWPNPP